ncbi:MAG TPA: hypothetical protein VHF69_07080, partial [Candidatus Synoicihabitans sp.]|nr:hypothetical protein [Candidatus Synoicihabitans sp.]
TQFTGLGYSSVPRSEGFENRTFFATEGERRGLFSVFGGAPHPFDTVKYAPADADMFVETDFDLGTALHSVFQVMAKFMPEKVEAIGYDVATRGSQSPPLATALALKGRLTLVLRMGEVLPMPGTPPQRPIALLLRVEGIGPQLRELLQKAPLEHRRAGNVDLYLAPSGMPNGMRPVLAIDGEQVFLSLSEGFLNESLARGATHLGEQAPYQEALAALGREGNGIVYVSPAFFTALRQMLTQFHESGLGVMGALGNSDALMEHMIERLPQPTQPVVSVTTNLSDGILTRNWGPLPLKSEQIFFALLNPELAGDLLTAALLGAHNDRVRRREEAKVEIAVRENLERIDAAARKYFASHDDVSFVGFADLAAAYPELDDIEAVANESYAEVTVERLSDVVETYTGKGQHVRYVRPLTDAQREQIRRNLAQVEKAVQAYFASNPEAEAMSAYEGSEYIAEVPEGLPVVAGESYAELYISRHDAEIVVMTPGGQTESLAREVESAPQE